VPNQNQPAIVVASTVLLVPTKEHHLKSLTHAERIAVFGSFDFTPSPQPGNPEHVTIDPVWLRANIITIKVPQLHDRKVQCNKLVADDLLALYKAWDDAGLIGRILRFNGGFSPRYKRNHSGGAENLSNHAHGSAIDQNAPWNRLGAVPAASGTKGSLVELVPIAEGCGWAWGGWWNTPDGMHFDWARRRT